MPLPTGAVPVAAFLLLLMLQLLVVLLPLRDPQMPPSCFASATLSCTAAPPRSPLPLLPPLLQTASLLAVMQLSLGMPLPSRRARLAGGGWVAVVAAIQ